MMALQVQSVMLTALTLIVLFLNFDVQARSLPLERKQTRQNGITWSHCPTELNAFDPFDRTFDCGILNVPLDYTNESSNMKVDIEIIRIPALYQPKKGSILINFGGPGGDALSNMASVSPLVQP
jgi:hypothetical protein